MMDYYEAHQSILKFMGRDRYLEMIADGILSSKDAKEKIIELLNEWHSAKRLLDQLIKKALDENP